MRTLLNLSALGLLATLAGAQETLVRPETSGATGAPVEVTRSYRASELIGMEVRNSKGESLGEIEDIVIDWNNGRVRYAAISFGGFLGIGDKLFAVPMDVVTVKHTTDDTYFVMDVAKERLETAPGFNQDAWPDLGNNKWHEEVDQFYQQERQRTQGAATHTGTVVGASDGRLTMTGADGTNHTHVVGADVPVTIDGQEGSLEDLKRGQQVTVTTVKRDKALVVTAIKAKNLRK